jgi:prophage regulatory protein
MKLRTDENELLLTNKPPLKILRLPAVEDRTGLARSTIYLKISQNAFPAPISLGDRSVGWIEEEINSWIKERIESSRSKKNGGGV